MLHGRGLANGPCREAGRAELCQTAIAGSVMLAHCEGRLAYCACGCGGNVASVSTSLHKRSGLTCGTRDIPRSTAVVLRRETECGGGVGKCGEGFRWAAVTDGCVRSVGARLLLSCPLVLKKCDEAGKLGPWALRQGLTRSRVADGARARAGWVRGG